MKKLMIGFLIILFSMSFALQADAGRKQQQNNSRGQYYYGDQQRGGHMMDRDGYRYKYHGHRNHMPPGHYRGHWRSWDSWHRHYEGHRHLYKNHRYYRDNTGCLYFEFEDENGRFVFSIGR